MSTSGELARNTTHKEEMLMTEPELTGLSQSGFAQKVFWSTATFTHPHSAGSFHPTAKTQ